MDKRGRKQIGEFKITGTEAKRRFDDRHAAIDKQIDNARQQIDWKRRNKAEQSLPQWVKTYCVGILIDDEPPEKGYQILDEMESALSDSRPYMIMMGRGGGKTSYVECACVYALATNKRRFPVVISNNARASCNILNDIFRMFQEVDTPFAQDYPDLCKPIEIANGSYRRKQTYKGVGTEIAKTSSQINLARLTDENGVLPKTGCVIATRGISSGIRGLKHHTMRPDLVLLDDLQTSEDAENPSSVEKLLNIIKKDVMNLAGKGKLAVLQTATPICPEDLTEKIQSDSNWKTTVWPSIVKWPKDILDNGDKGLWAKYFKMFDSENVNDKKHKESLEFYKTNRDKMDEGAVVFNPTRFKKSDGHISALQSLLEKRHMIGDSAFSAEFQMKPKRYSFHLDISPKTVLTRTTQNEKLVVPDGYVFVSASTDLNVSYAATTVVTAFKPDMTAHVLYHHITRSRIDSLLNDTEYNQKVYALLTKIGQSLKNLDLKIDGWAIDAGGKNWDAVCTFAKNSMSLCGVSACAFAGRASHIFNPFIRSRLRDAIGRTVLCGNDQEHVKSGGGFKYMFFDADIYREMVQRAFISEVGSPGCCTLYNGDADEHSDFAIQICNEKLLFVKHNPDGRNFYTWKTMEPHDYLDCMSMCFAVASSQGISSSVSQNKSLNQNKRNKVMLPIKRKPTRIKIV